MRAVASWSLSMVWDWSKGQEMIALTGTAPLPYLFTSFWSAFLGESVHPDLMWYAAPTAIVLLAVAGYVSFVTRLLGSGHPTSLRPLPIRVALVAAIVATFATAYLRYLAAYQDDSFAYRLQVLQGRFLFVALVPLALLLAEGCSMLPRDRRNGLAFVTVVGMLGFFDTASLLSLAGWFRWPAIG